MGNGPRHMGNDPHRKVRLKMKMTSSKAFTHLFRADSGMFETRYTSWGNLVVVFYALGFPNGIMYRTKADDDSKALGDLLFKGAETNYHPRLQVKGMLTTTTKDGLTHTVGEVEEWKEV